MSEIALRGLLLGWFMGVWLGIALGGVVQRVLDKRSGF
jgi:hypothetical protein